MSYPLPMKKIMGWLCWCAAAVLVQCETVLAQELKDNAMATVVPYKRMFDDPMQFHGYPGEDPDAATIDEVRIGFFAPSSKDHSLGEAMWRGAGLAIDFVNEQGGFKGKPFRLIPRWSNDPWRGGTEQIIQLVYRDRIWALIGGVDGETTHLAEQITNKARLPLIAPVATDSTLTEIRIPWMFRLAPSDRQQAQCMVALLTGEPTAQRIAVIHSTKHDARVGVEELLKTLAGIQRTPVARFEIPARADDLDGLADRLRAMAVDCLILWCPTADAQTILTSLQHSEASWPIYAPIELDTPEFHTAAQRWPKPVTLLTAWGEMNQTDERRLFFKHYWDRYKTEPHSAAAASFDAVNLIVKAIREAGLNRAGIRESIAGIENYHGAIGVIRWDNGGGNATPIGMRYFNRPPS